MAKLSKRAKAIQEKVTPGKLYSIEEALQLLKDLATVKFAESVDISLNLGVDARKSDQVVRGATVLPNGTGKTVRVAVFTQGANADAAREAGADIVGMDDLAEEVGGLSTAVVEVVKENGGNWAEHQWVQQTLLTASRQKDINETVAHNYRLYEQYSDQLSDVGW